MQGVGPSCIGSLHPHDDQSQVSPDPLDFLSIASPKDKPWDTHRLEAEEVSEIFAGGLPHHQRQAERMRSCSTNLEMGWVLQSTETGLTKLKLKAARFCRVRTCPVCQWRRALMWVARFYHAFPRIYVDHPELRYALLTFTVRNCKVSELRETIKTMNAAWKRITERQGWPAVGFVRSLEVTRDKDGLAHPHFHVLLALPSGYFVGRKYLSTAKWAEMWREALRIDYTPICDVRLVKPRDYSESCGKTIWRDDSGREAFELGMDEVRNAIIGETPYSEPLVPTKVEALLSAITEVIKYAVKPGDMVADADWFLTLSDELRNARAVAVGGILRQYLKTDEPENLVSEDEESVKKNAGGVHFGWREDPRFAQYKRKKGAA